MNNETNSSCKFYDWNSNPNYPSYPREYGAFCHKYDIFFRKDKKENIYPNCSKCKFCKNK